MLREAPGSFVHEGHRLVYTDFGEGDRPLVLIHGLLLGRRMHAPLARELARRGNRVITLDLLGHGESDRPPNMWEYSMSFFGEQVVGLLDHLDLDKAVVGGTSLGANVTLEVASLAPTRLQGMVVEMPVLDNALLASALAFTPLMAHLEIGAPIARTVSRVLSLIPRTTARSGPLFWLDVMLDTQRQAPEPSAAVLQGLFMGRTAPHRTERRTFRTPALVIGHYRDPVHPFSDAGMLAEELPNATLLEADSMLELRLAPDRLTGQIASFIEECWSGSRSGETATVPPRHGSTRR